MAKTLDEFVKTKKRLLCVDSDGCAMDTMNVKHIRCFGPCFVDVFGITDNVSRVLDRWNEINLFEITRGINRFLGCAHILSELFPDDDNIKAFCEWTSNAKELSEKSVKAEFESNSNPIFNKAYEWSRAVNMAINALSDNDKVAFSGVAAALKSASKQFDIAIVSSANYAAVAAEWENCELLQYVDVLTTQSDGSKAHCISELLKKGYDEKDTVMCGDAEGDLRAAEVNGVCFYPILVNRESESWNALDSFLRKFVSGSAESEQKLLRDEFYSNLHTGGI